MRPSTVLMLLALPLVCRAVGAQIWPTRRPPVVVTRAPEDERAADPERPTFAGPRFGVTMLSGHLADSLSKEGVTPLISQFGWQIEHQFLMSQDGPAALIEVVGLIGGVEQSKFLPSVSVLFGLRMPNGAELGVGPNLAAHQSALVLAGGMDVRYDALHFPLTLAIVPAKSGTRVTALVGFTFERER